MDAALLIDFLSATVRIATPILMAAMGGILIERSGTFAVGLEGMMLSGAFSGVVGAFLYVLGCREPLPGLHERYVAARWRQALGSAMHCVAGDGVGILAGAVLARVLGLGGLGHMAVKLGVALGAEVTMLSSSASKEKDAKRLGAHKFALTKDPEVLKSYGEYFDFIIDTVSAQHDFNTYLNLLKRDGTLILVGAPPKPNDFHAFSIIPKRRRIAGSMIGGIKETQEMLDFCGEHNITADVEIIGVDKINEAYERMLKSDIKYRFSIDMSTLNG